MLQPPRVLIMALDSLSFSLSVAPLFFICCCDLPCFSKGQRHALFLRAAGAGVLRSGVAALHHRLHSRRARRHSRPTVQPQRRLQERAGVPLVLPAGRQPHAAELAPLQSAGELQLGRREAQPQPHGLVGN